MAGIMIVEDQAEFREMLKEALLRRKYSIIVASDGKEAMLKFKASVVDLVVTDILMPEEDGLKVIMKLKEIKPGIKIIAISGGGKAGPGNYLNLAKALGADDILSKPFSLNTLISRIEELLNPIGFF
ncbi:MAG TPA: response regulator [Bacteroidales bacterium]|nr:response regulator [Bacteroidales bacterium]HCI56391.1 response regulator [Bacteroidales bacterium]HRC89517.1 response regulator [Bacteroidales bacterium]